MKPNKVLHDVIMQVVDNQIEGLDPPETKATYERLLKEGITAKEAKRLIACVVVTEINEFLKRQEAFDRTRFITALNQLPEVQWESDENEEN